MAQKYRVHVNTIRKWKRRKDFNDRSSCRKKVSLTLSEFEEAYRCLKRHGLNRNDKLVPKEDKKERYKKFKDYPPGYIHVDKKELPKINGVKKYLFLAIDRKTRICHIKVYDRQDSESAVDFLKYCRQVFPFPITTVLTDNGKCFTDRFARGRQAPSGKHVFDKTCKELGIEHRLIQTYTPTTNGMVERMNGRFNEHVLDKYMLAYVTELEAKLMEYIYHYNHYIKQKSL